MPNQWARMAQGPTNGPERPRAKQMGPNGPGSNNWARTAQGPTNGPERPRVQQLGPNGPGSNNWARMAQGPTIGPERRRDQQLGPNGPGPKKWARTARVQQWGLNSPGSNNWARAAQGPIGPERPRVHLGPMRSSPVLPVVPSTWLPAGPASRVAFRPGWCICTWVSRAMGLNLGGRGKGINYMRRLFQCKA